MKTWSHILMLTAALLVVGCSQEWRQGDAQLTSDEMLKNLAEVTSQTTSTNGGSDSAVTAALAFQNDPNTTIFYADAPGPLGQMQELLALDHMNFLGTGADLSYRDIKLARVFFLDSPSNVDRQDGLVIGISTDGGAYKYYGFSGTNATVDDGEFSVTMTGASGQKVTLRSWDTDGSDLKGVIQLRVYQYDANGNEQYVGKITTLVGYGG